MLERTRRPGPNQGPDRKSKTALNAVIALALLSTTSDTNCTTYKCNKSHCEDDIKEGVEEIENIFKTNDIDISQFLKDTNNVLKMKHRKKNTLFLYGQSNSCKTLIQSLILSKYEDNYAICSFIGRNRFELEDCWNKPYIAINEFRASIFNTDIAKLLFGGERLCIERKCRQSVIIDRKPCIVTAQHGWDFWLNYQDKLALINRVYMYNFVRPYEPKCQICPNMWAEFLKKYE